MPTTVATPTDITKVTTRLAALEARANEAAAKLAALEERLTVLSGGTATEEVGD